MNDGMRDPKQVARLRTLANSVRRRDLEMVYAAKLGHIGGDFSARTLRIAVAFGWSITLWGWIAYRVWRKRP